MCAGALSWWSHHSLLRHRSKRFCVSPCLINTSELSSKTVNNLIRRSKLCVDSSLHLVVTNQYYLEIELHLTWFRGETWGHWILPLTCLWLNYQVVAVQLYNHFSSWLMTFQKGLTCIFSVVVVACMHLCVCVYVCVCIKMYTHIHVSINIAMNTGKMLPSI